MIIRRGRLGVWVRYVMACALLIGWLVPFVVAAPASAAYRDERPARVGFGEEAFKFEVDVKDDKKDDGGGSLKAVAKLTFTTTPEEQKEWRDDAAAEAKRNKSACVPPLPAEMWTCKIEVHIPIRSEAMQNMSKRFAAQLTADFTSEARNHMKRPRTQVEAMFCQDFVKAVDKLFSVRFQGKLGQSVKLPS